MTDLITLYKHVKPDVPGCPDPLLDRAIINAAIEFHEESKIYCAELTAINVVADEPEYDLVPPAGYAVVDIRRARFDDKPLIAKSRDQLDQMWVDQNTRSLFHYHHMTGYNFDADSWEVATTSRPQFFYQPTSSSLRLVAIPDTAYVGGLKVNAALKPTPDATAIEDWIYNDYYKAIAAGAIAEVARIPEKMWTNPGLGDLRDREFRAGIAKARGRSLRDHARNDRQTGRTRTHV